MTRHLQHERVSDRDHQLDLALAAELQAALLPKSCPAECRHQVAAARNRMCGSVGGDFYDFIRINDEQHIIVIGDVVGHGTRAALMMAQIMGFLRSRPGDLSHPTETVKSLNEMLIDLGNRIDSVTPCSILYGVFDVPSAVGFFVNAGHPAPILCQDGGCGVLGHGARNLLLGIERFEPSETCLTFRPGQRLAMYTDGIIDARNARGEHFGLSRLRKVVSQNAGNTPQACADAVFEAVDRFRRGTPQDDDETIVVIDRI